MTRRYQVKRRRTNQRIPTGRTCVVCNHEIDRLVDADGLIRWDGYYYCDNPLCQQVWRGRTYEYICDDDHVFGDRAMGEP